MNPQRSPFVELTKVVTHRYDPVVGPYRNFCELPDSKAADVLECLRGESRRTLKADYLERRRRTERWLMHAASEALGRAVDPPPVYFFLGDFSHSADPSRPESLLVSIDLLPVRATTFTLGDSMSVAEKSDSKVYGLAELSHLLENRKALTGFGMSDKAGYQKEFVEIQVWDRSSLPLALTSTE